MYGMRFLWLQYSLLQCSETHQWQKYWASKEKKNNLRKCMSRFENVHEQMSTDQMEREQIKPELWQF